MYLKVLLCIFILSETKFFILNTKFCYKNGFLPFNYSYIALIQNLTLNPFFSLLISTDKIVSRVAYQKRVH